MGFIAAYFDYDDGLSETKRRSGVPNPSNTPPTVSHVGVDKVELGSRLSMHETTFRKINETSLV